MTILVTGATGNIGRRIVDRLVELGANDIRALTKNPAKANLPAGVSVFTGYLGAVASLDGVFDGVDRMYLAPLTQTLDATLELIRRAGVGYVVALSGGAHWAEHAGKVRASGVAHTQLGPGEFLDNFTIWADQIKQTGTVREPYPDVVEAPISMDDIARVAAALLVEPAHRGQMLELTGPEALSRAEIAAQIGVGIGRTVTFETCTHDEAVALLTPVMGDAATWYYDLVRSRVEPQRANRIVDEITGTPAEAVPQWAARNAGLFG
ncbi:NAD(P)H-binding protein [Mycolicibacterium smegmatis]|uniref:NmrA family NAD(P)-binding protein n=1 Tax=Mycolicibacterium smegmatis TaxID=1772 RepID=UPI0005D8BA79|nr:NAD(P)H-binding protein [Mycolicibacterium smegmatis]MDF1903693.1 NAD(P)H-binding protein [Mycolicibacterium smegmatis]MDF1910234.1 NAD(P)H-binding protein [Mycolicibacterium smegmatis]MDF1922046.1 NAD(P)H-binding protein [Mycolicibacterium smegmatis]MDF1928570.1 NAD(P)H-binding protein [Mycolicibacterium smegmatis]UAK55873.1 NAD(P)H-binding protein [Mycolicibacterium smegmatis]